MFQYDLNESVSHNLSKLPKDYKLYSIDDGNAFLSRNDNNEILFDINGKFQIRIVNYNNRYHFKSFYENTLYNSNSDVESNLYIVKYKEVPFNNIKKFIFKNENNFEDTIDLFKKMDVQKYDLTSGYMSMFCEVPKGIKMIVNDYSESTISLSK